MLKRLIGISVALSVLVAASAAGATAPAQRFSAQSGVRQQAPLVRVAVQRSPSFRPTAYKPMSQQAERPDVARGSQPAGSRAEMGRATSQRVEFMQVRNETQCVPSKTCGRIGATPRAARHQDRKAIKRQLAKHKPTSATKF